MSEIKTKIRTYNDVIDLFGEEKAADMLSEALDWSTIASGKARRAGSRFRPAELYGKR